MPIVAFAGGSGITPVISLVKSTLATTDRPVRLLYANRDADSVIFRAELDDLDARAPGSAPGRPPSRRRTRLRPLERRDATFVGDELDADFYICGPGPFMDVVEDALAQAAVSSEQVFIERFAFASTARLDEPPATPAPAADGSGATESVVIVLDGRRHEVNYQAGETFLETARRAGLRAPFSCEVGQLRDVHGASRRRRGDDAGQQRADAGGGRGGLGAHVSGLPRVTVRHGRVRVVSVAPRSRAASISWTTNGRRRDG